MTPAEIGALVVGAVTALVAVGYRLGRDSENDTQRRIRESIEREGQRIGGWVFRCRECSERIAQHVVEHDGRCPVCNAPDALVLQSDDGPAGRGHFGRGRAD